MLPQVEVCTVVVSGFAGICRYADRARHIRNKPVINRDPLAAEVGCHGPAWHLASCLLACNTHLVMFQSEGLPGYMPMHAPTSLHVPACLSFRLLPSASRWPP
jgi:hypothetical protein